MQRRFPTRNTLAIIGAAFFLAASFPSLSAPLPKLQPQDHSKTSTRVERVEPSSWWVGMQSPALQLMVYGKHLGGLEARIQHPGVTLVKSSRTENANYLFLDLLIAPDAAVGKVEIEWLKDQQVQFKSEFTLNARRPGSAQRLGFTPADAIYLIVPDRFANGDTRNDSIIGMLDPAKRSDPGGRHGGDLQGMTEHLDYIAGLGFTMLWPTPLVENNQAINSYHGYAATDFYRVDPRLGNNEDYRQLVVQAKKRGVGVIHDVVLNHIGSQHWWMQDLPSHDWLNQHPSYVETNHVRATVQDPHASIEDRNKFADGWFVKTMPDLNQKNPYLANYLIQNAIWWIEYADLSGLRVDTYSYSNKEFLAQWSKRITDEYPLINLVGEEWSMNPAIVAYWQKDKVNQDGYRSYMPSMMDFSVYENLHTSLVGGKDGKADIGKLYLAATDDFQYAHPENLTIFEGNHDTPRIFSALNRDPALLRMALVYLATMRGIPQMFYGTEILMASPKKRDDGKVRGDFPGGWPGDQVNAFSGKNLSQQSKATQDFVRALFNWRKSEKAIHDGKFLHFLPQDDCYVYFRISNKKTIMVVMNRKETSQHLNASRFNEVLKGFSKVRDVLSGSTQDIRQHIKIEGKTAHIFELQ